MAVLPGAVVNLTEYGQFGNRFVLGAHLMAYAIETQRPFLNLGMFRYARDVPPLRGSLTCGLPPLRFPIGRDQGRRAVRRVVISRRVRAAVRLLPLRAVIHRLADGERCDLTELAATPNRSLWEAFDGWAFRGPELVQKHRDPILRHYDPRPPIAREASNDARIPDVDCPSSVGIHVRRGDYAEWEGGRYFYGDDIYRRLIEQMRGLLGPRCRFTLVSNEPLSPILTEAPATVWHRGNAMEDLAVLSRCDYVTGPPSSYSTVAAFLGGARLYHLSDGRLPSSVSEFHAPDALQWG